MESCAAPRLEKHSFLWLWFRLLPFFFIAAIFLIHVEGRGVDIGMESSSLRLPHLMGWPLVFQVLAAMGLIFAQATSMVWGIVVGLRLAGSPVAYDGIAEPRIRKQNVVRFLWRIIAGIAMGAFAFRLTWWLAASFVITVPDFFDRPAVYDIMLLPMGLVGWMLTPILVRGVCVLGSALRNPHPWDPKESFE